MSIAYQHALHQNLLIYFQLISIDKKRVDLWLHFPNTPLRCFQAQGPVYICDIRGSDSGVTEE
jgi:hypothetical protein